MLTNPSPSTAQFTDFWLLRCNSSQDMSFPSATLVLSNLLPLDEQGTAGSLVATVVNYSISCGLGELVLVLSLAQCRHDHAAEDS